MGVEVVHTLAFASDLDDSVSESVASIGTARNVRRGLEEVVGCKETLGKVYGS